MLPATSVAENKSKHFFLGWPTSSLLSKSVLDHAVEVLPVNVALPRLHIIGHFQRYFFFHQGPRKGVISEQYSSYKVIQNMNSIPRPSYSSPLPLLLLVPRKHSNECNPYFPRSTPVNANLPKNRRMAKRTSSSSFLYFDWPFNNIPSSATVVTQYAFPTLWNTHLLKIRQRHTKGSLF